MEVDKIMEDGKGIKYFISGRLKRSLFLFKNFFFLNFLKYLIKIYFWFLNIIFIFDVFFFFHNKILFEFFIFLKF